MKITVTVENDGDDLRHRVFVGEDVEELSDDIYVWLAEDDTDSQAALDDEKED